MEVLDFNVGFLFIHVLLVYKFNFHLRFQFGLIKNDKSHDETCIFTRSVICFHAGCSRLRVKQTCSVIFFGPFSSFEDEPELKFSA